MRRWVGRWWPFLVFVGVATAVAGGLWWAYHAGTDVSFLDSMTAVVMALSAIVGGSWVWARRRTTTAVVTGEELDRLADDLADSLRESWTVEEANRRVADPWPLPVRWAVSARAEAVMPAWSVVRGRAGAGSVPGDGEYTEIARVFTGPDHPGRLVVLGGPGTGKTALVLRLTLDLLTGRQAGEPVAVLLGLAGWDPAQRFDQWLAAALAGLYPVLGRTAAARDGVVRTLAGHLVSSRRILPVLDGLDEMPSAHRAEAISTLGRALTRDRPLVLTCRIEEYERAVAAAGRPLAAVAVELLPLDRTPVLEWLRAGTAGPPSRWDPIERSLARDPTGPLGAALRTPLVASLARAVYACAQADPRQLLHPVLTTAGRVQEYLLGGLVSAVYGTECRATRRRTPWPARTDRDAARAHRSLAFLAAHLTRRRTRDLAWWQLRTTMPWPVTSMAAGALGGSVFGLLGWAFGWLLGRTGEEPGLETVFGAVLGPASGLALAVMVGLRSRTAGTPLHLTRPSPRRLASGLVLGSKYGLIAGLAAGLPAGFEVAMASLWEIRNEATPASDPASDPMFDLVFGLTFDPLFILMSILAFGLLFGLTAAAVLGLVLGFTIGPVFGSASGTRIDRAPTPASLLRADRAVYRMLGASSAVVTGLAAALATGLIISTDQPTDGPPPSLPELLLTMLLVTLMVAPFGLVAGLVVGTAFLEWPMFGMVRILMMARRRTPLRLMSFLAEAHDRGVLRQSGGIYQFRHARLQDHLARHPAPPPRTVTHAR
jgi:hypothetical protein